MYHSHWGLRRSPFRNCLDPRLFYQSPVHDEALARLHFLVEERRRLGLLMGPQGSGKSLLLQVFLEQLRRRGWPVVSLNLIGVDPSDMLWLLASELRIPVDANVSTLALWRAVTDRIAEYRYQQLSTVILMDDADRAFRPTLLQVARLAQHDPSPDSRLTMVLAGNSQQMGRLGHSLLDLAELRIDLEGWEATDTRQFLAQSLAQAGRQTPVFADSAVTRLHELSQGIPRRVSQLADLALAAGAGRELPEIDAEVVESVYRELGVVEV